MTYRDLVVAVVGALLCATAGMVMRRADDRLLSSDIGLIRYGDIVMVQVSFVRDSSPQGVSVRIDDRRVLDNVPVQVLRYGIVNLYATVPGIGPRASVTVTLDSGQVVSRTVKVVDGRVPTLMPLEVSADGMRTMPDLPGPGDRCAPVAAANGLISMARAYGADARLPALSDTVIAELSDDMRWQAGRGVNIRDYVGGADLWAQKKGLPIHMRTVGTPQGTGTLEALASRSFAQMELVWRDGDGVRTGAHAVSVTVRRSGPIWYAHIQDPLSPQGTDVYRIDGTRIVDYPYYAGIVTVGRGFIQEWTGPTTN